MVGTNNTKLTICCNARELDGNNELVVCDDSLWCSLSLKVFFA